VLDSGEVSKHWNDAPTFVVAKVTSDPLSKICRFANIGDSVVFIDHQVHPGGPRKRLGKAEFFCLRVTRELSNGNKIIEASDSPAGCPFDEEVQQIPCRKCIIERPVARTVFDSKPLSESSEFEVTNLVSE
jgi:hypothetical protein